MTWLFGPRYDRRALNDPAPVLPPPSPWIAVLGRLRRPALVAAACLAACITARLALLATYREDFAGLTGGQVVLAFFRGLRFDVSAAVPVIGLPVFLLLLPIGGTAGPKWRRFWAWASFVVFTIFAAVLSIDVLYFGEVHRHAGPEVTEPGDLLRAIFKSAASRYLLAVGLFSALIAGLGWVWKRELDRAEPPPLPRRAELALALAAALLMYFGERGTLTGKRLRVVHAFQDVPAPAAHLTLNGPYCVLHSLVHSRAVRTTFLPPDEALRSARECLLTDGESVPDEKHPLFRQREAPSRPPPNVVVMMLESWDASATDVHRAELGLPPLGCTPRYDQISREGRLFTRYFAGGQRSMDGLGAMLSGFPTLPGTSYIGRGLEQNSMTFLGDLARREGYDTWFITSAERDSFRVDAIAARTGFTHYLGAEDIPPGTPPDSRAGLRGCCWDHEMFQEVNRRLAGAPRPFLAFLYTSSTHHPFLTPPGRPNRHSPDSLATQYLNSLEYGDTALGEFFREAKTKDWYANTVFLVTADHIGGPGLGIRREDPSTHHHIPCFVLGPGVEPGIDRRTGSQLDVLPTIVDLAGWRQPYAALGSSLFGSPAAGRSALCVQGDLVLRIEDHGFVLHSLDRRVQGSGDADAIERRLLSVVQTAYGLLRTNRVAPAR